MKVLVNLRHQSKIKTGTAHSAMEVVRCIGPLLQIVSPGPELRGPAGTKTLLEAIA